MKVRLFMKYSEPRNPTPEHTYPVVETVRMKRLQSWEQLIDDLRDDEVIQMLVDDVGQTPVHHIRHGVEAVADFKRVQHGQDLKNGHELHTDHWLLTQRVSS